MTNQTQTVNHVHHYNREPREVGVSIKLAKNTKGYNWEVSVTGAGSVDEAMALAREADARLKAEYGADER